MNIINQKIGTTQDWNFGLITREVFRVDENLFEINDTSDGWLIAEVDLGTMEALVRGEDSLLNLEWR